MRLHPHLFRLPATNRASRSLGMPRAGTAAVAHVTVRASRVQKAEVKAEATGAVAVVDPIAVASAAASEYRAVIVRRKTSRASVWMRKAEPCRWRPARQQTSIRAWTRRKATTARMLRANAVQTVRHEIRIAKTAAVNAVSAARVAAMQNVVIAPPQSAVSAPPQSVVLKATRTRIRRTHAKCESRGSRAKARVHRVKRVNRAASDAPAEPRARTAMALLKVLQKARRVRP